MDLGAVNTGRIFERATTCGSILITRWAELERRLVDRGCCRNIIFTQRRSRLFCERWNRFHCALNALYHDSSGEKLRCKYAERPVSAM
jgi:hypothetical protein